MSIEELRKQIKAMVEGKHEGGEAKTTPKDARQDLDACFIIAEVVAEHVDEHIKATCGELQGGRQSWKAIKERETKTQECMNKIWEHFRFNEMYCSYNYLSFDILAGNAKDIIENLYRDVVALEEAQKMAGEKQYEEFFADFGVRPPRTLEDFIAAQGEIREFSKSLEMVERDVAEGNALDSDFKLKGIRKLINAISGFGDREERSINNTGKSIADRVPEYEEDKKRYEKLFTSKNRKGIGKQVFDKQMERLGIQR